MQFLTPKDIDHKKLVQGCIDNDRKSQEKFYKRFFPVMEKMVRRHTQDKDQLLDILNNGFLRVFKKLNTFGFNGSLEGWVRKIVYHSMCDYFRKHAKDVKFLVYGDIEYTLKSKEGNRLYFEDLINMVNTLPEKHQKVFYMYAVEGYKHKEIGETLNISANTSKWYLAEARKKLMTNFKEELYQYEI